MYSEGWWSSYRGPGGVGRLNVISSESCWGLVKGEVCDGREGDMELMNSMLISFWAESHHM